MYGGGALAFVDVAFRLNVLPLLHRVFFCVCLFLLGACAHSARIGSLFFENSMTFLRKIQQLYDNVIF